MIDSITEKEWVAKRTGNKHFCKVAIRTCDSCEKQEEMRLTTVQAGQRQWGGKTYCYKCAQSKRIMPKGASYAKWKHGKTSNGYVRITINKKRILEHVYVMSQHLSRDLQKGETVHHIDMDKVNNKLENLYLFSSQSEHQKCHTSMEVCGFSLLNQKIWFDYENQIYSLDETKQPICDYYQEFNDSLYKVRPRNNFVQKSCYLECSRKELDGSIIKTMYHTLAAEFFIGRKLFHDECVHHVNGNTLDNSKNNLCVMKRKKHTFCHHSLQKCVANLFKSGIIGFSSGIYFLQGELK